MLVVLLLIQLLVLHTLLGIMLDHILIHLELIRIQMAALMLTLIMRFSIPQPDTIMHRILTHMHRMGIMP